MLGLSHPSRRAEWENIKRVGSSKERSCSFFLRMRSYADVSSENSFPRLTLLLMLRPVFLSMLKYPLWTAEGFLHVEVRY